MMLTPGGFSSAQWPVTGRVGFHDLPCHARGQSIRKGKRESRRLRGARVLVDQPVNRAVPDHSPSGRCGQGMGQSKPKSHVRPVMVVMTKVRSQDLIGATRAECKGTVRPEDLTWL